LGGGYFLAEAGISRKPSQDCFQIRVRCESALFRQKGMLLIMAGFNKMESGYNTQVNRDI